ncbi:FKBP-type peptidyl-prolyl cis-trans isomerase [Nocardioides litoris]|uniref:FKBP-type peptidyl-prolyl cis-trans isomerase n=1 Tax=Nocardioides litoris TaxID=1926648 RepID=UPI00111DEBBB|nr:FKBP-type peptidyl-prolyl cis-trans isomerase [Nocardioides litoris]
MNNPVRRWSIAVSAAVLALSLAACGEDDTAADPEGSGSSESSSSAPAEGGSTEAAELPEWAPAILTEGDAVTGLDFTDTPEPSGELQVATVTEGDGPPVEVGQTLTVNYLGAVYQGTEPFDESYSGGQPVQFPIGVGQLIQGWDQAIPGTPVGSRIIMSIPPDLGYGEQGSPPTIPGGSTLFFVIDVIDAA